MDSCLVELYNDKGARIHHFYAVDPMKAMRELAWYFVKNDGFDCVTATCYLNQQPQWELEIK